jgi:hypothetical protein
MPLARCAAGRGAGNRVDLQPRLLNRAIQDTPGERTVRTAPLQGKVGQQGVLVRVLSTRESGVHCASSDLSYVCLRA